MAVVDTGVAKVADLAGRVIAGVDLSGGSDPYKDEFGHGTFVAGLIAGNGASSGGQYKGVAPKAKIVSIKIAGADGASDVSHVLAAMQWAVSYKSQLRHPDHQPLVGNRLHPELRPEPAQRRRRAGVGQRHRRHRLVVQQRPGGGNGHQAR